MYKVIISLGKGNLETGLALVTAQLWNTDGRLILKEQGHLCTNSKLLELYRQWRSLYLAYYLDSQQSMRIEIVEEDESPLQFSYSEFKDVCRELSVQFNAWLETDSFTNIRWHLGINLQPTEEIQIIIETEETQLRQLPWHLWNFLEDYPLAEIALSLPVYQHISPSRNRQTSKINVLGVMGNPVDNEIETDKLLLEQTSQAQVKFLHQPTLSELKTQLRQGNWNIFFFAGHSSSGIETGRLLVNQDEDHHTIEMTELEPAIKQSIRQGLQLAIFNSCDGLALAWNLAKLNIPQTIVMSQPVTDEVAQTFLKHFLAAITQGKSSCLAVREARERLKDMEDEYPCASWLPTICQNPATPAFTWQSEKIISSNARSKWQRLFKTAGLSLTVTALTIGMRSLGLWQGIELKSYDWLVRMRSHPTLDDRFLLVTVSEADIQYQDRQGMSRQGSLGDEALEQALKKLEPYQPEAIALDIYHDSAFTSSLAQKLAQTNFIAPCEIAQSQSHPHTIAPPPGIPIQQVGFTDFPLDPDFVVRRQILLMDSTVSCPTDTSLGMRVALEYLAQTKNLALEITDNGEAKIGDTIFTRFSHNAGGYQLPSAEALGYQVLLNHVAATQFPEISLRDLLESGLDSQLADLAQGKIILIGTNKFSKDSHLISHSREKSSSKVSGCSIHAQTIGQIINLVEGKASLLWWWQQWQEGFWIGVWAGIGGVIALYSSSKKQLIFIPVIAISTLTGISIFLFYQGGWIPLLPPACALAATSLFVLLFNLNSKHS